MELYYAITFFIFGTIFGSFYNVVGYRLPKGESILYPPSHCPNCNHRLGPLELIPIFSFFIQRGKCVSCHQKISWFYPIFEFSCGLLFAIASLIFGLSLELAIALTFISMLCIIVLSDYEYMIIPDEVLIFFSIVLTIEFFIKNGLASTGMHLLEGILAFFTMWGIKKIGDFMFKKESMGGGDIKLMFVFGLVLGYPLAIISIFVGSIIGLPISLIIVAKKSSHEIPFGPFLSAGALILLLTQIDFDVILKTMETLMII